jgi:hypothetical protein
MDVKQRMAAYLPHKVEDVEKDGPVDIAELWLMARAYSRLRHRTSPVRHPERRQQFESLKIHCISLAVARAPAMFLVFVDPGYRHLVVIYHRVERTLLHLPLAMWRQREDDARAISLNRSRAIVDAHVETAAVA